MRWHVPLPKGQPARPEHYLERKPSAIFRFEISGDDMKRLDALDRNYSALGGAGLCLSVRADRRRRVAGACGAMPRPDREEDDMPKRGKAR